jgi:hypothetical protein
MRIGLDSSSLVAYLFVSDGAVYERGHCKMVAVPTLAEEDA